MSHKELLHYVIVGRQAWMYLFSTYSTKMAMYCTHGDASLCFVDREALLYLIDTCSTQHDQA